MNNIINSKSNATDCATNNASLNITKDLFDLSEKQLKDYIKSINEYENVEEASKLITFNPNLWITLSDNLRNNFQLFKTLFNSNQFNLNNFSFGFLPTEFIQKNEQILYILSALQNDVSNKLNDISNTTNLKHQTIFFKKNDYSCSFLFQNLSFEQKNDKELIIKFLKISPQIYKNIPEQFKNNDEIISLCLERDPLTLQYMPLKIKTNKQIVLNCIKKNPQSLLFATSELKADRQLVMSAVRQSPDLINASTGRIKENKYLFKILLQQCIQNKNKNTLLLLQHMNQKFKSDPEILLRAAQYHHYFIATLIPQALRNKIEKITEKNYNSLNIDELKQALTHLVAQKKSTKEFQHLNSITKKQLQQESNQNFSPDSLKKKKVHL